MHIIEVNEKCEPLVYSHSFASEKSLMSIDVFEWGILITKINF